MGDRGRLVLPAALRREIGLTEGDELLVTVEDGAIRMSSRRERAHATRGVFKHLAPDRSLVEELMAERRADARRETGEAG